MHKKNLQGFTLIELLVVFSLIGIVMTASFASYTTYNQSRVIQTAGADLVDTLQVAKSRSLTQVKPSECDTLKGYQVSFTSQNTYTFSTICNSATFSEEKQLPSGITFSPRPPIPFFFEAGKGTVLSPGEIIITGYNKTKKITITASGIISIQ